MNLLRALLLVLLLPGCSFSGRHSVSSPPAWGETVSREVNALGIQNWIIIAEASFPVVSRRGVRTIVIDAEIPEVLDFVKEELRKSETLKLSFNTARELPFVENDKAPGIDHFRRQLAVSLNGEQVRVLDHRSLSLLAHSDSSKYAVLVLKTKTILPYSNVFIDLDSGFWDRESEDQLRRAMRAAEKKSQIR